MLLIWFIDIDILLGLPGKANFMKKWKTICEKQSNSKKEHTLGERFTDFEFYGSVQEFGGLNSGCLIFDFLQLPNNY